MPIKFNAVHDAYFFSGSGSGDIDSYLEKATGEFHTHSDFGDNFEELPDDVEDATKYIKMPSKRDLDLGKFLVLDFARDCMPGEYENIRDMFSRRGAYGRFKDFLMRTGKRDEWHAYENAAEEKALRKWCEENEIELED